MYGSIMRGRVKPGRRAEFEFLMYDLSVEHVAEHRGLLSVELAWQDEDPDRVVMILRFQDRDAYVRNAEHPKTQRNYRSWSALLEGDPEWIDVAYTDFIGEPRTETVRGEGMKSIEEVR
jgi:quinol monooxygenase YgiN